MGKLNVSDDDLSCDAREATQNILLSTIVFISSPSKNQHTHTHNTPTNTGINTKTNTTTVLAPSQPFQD